MANKFSMSIQERLEQEAKHQKAAAQNLRGNVAQDVQQEKEPTPRAEDAAPKIEIEEIKAPVESEKIETAAPDIAEPVQPDRAGETAAEPVRDDWSAYIRRGNERVAKNKTFYLDMAVIDAIKQAAKEQQVAESKLVNDILLHVLVGE